MEGIVFKEVFNVKNYKLKTFVIMLVIFIGLFPIASEVSAGADPFMGEIVLYPFNFAPKGWARCDGQLFQISQNPVLFSLLGTTYGGDGENTFALPNLNDQTSDGISALPWGANKGYYCIALQGIYPARP